MRTAVLVLSLLVACDSGGKDAVDDTVPAAEPGEFVAGFARARIPAPVGIGTAGFGPFGAPVSESPFSDIYPGTQAIFGHPEIKVMVLSRGEGFEAVFIRVDTVGMFAQFRTEIVREVSQRLGRDMDDAVLIGATHTHSGPGRVLNSGLGGGGSFFDIVVDKFLPEFYERFVDQIADTVDAAYADARAARLGTSVGTCSAGHNDRRCDDGETYENPTMPLLAIERDGVLDGVLIAYPVHGTVLGIDQLYLSQDVSGAIESAIEDRFDHAVPAILFNSWGADMSPSDPAIEMPPHGVRDPNYDRMWRVGSVVADSVDAAVASLEWTSEPDIRLQTRRVPIDRARIGYADDEFDYPYGAVYCTGEGDCEATMRSSKRSRPPILPLAPCSSSATRRTTSATPSSKTTGGTAATRRPVPCGARVRAITSKTASSRAGRPSRGLASPAKRWRRWSRSRTRSTPATRPSRRSTRGASRWTWSM